VTRIWVGVLRSQETKQFALLLFLAKQSILYFALVSKYLPMHYYNKLSKQFLYTENYATAFARFVHYDYVAQSTRSRRTTEREDRSPPGCLPLRRHRSTTTTISKYSRKSSARLAHLFTSVPSGKDAFGALLPGVPHLRE
jgi:hypothetical protein